MVHNVLGDPRYIQVRDGDKLEVRQEGTVKFTGTPSTLENIGRGVSGCRRHTKGPQGSQWERNPGQVPVLDQDHESLNTSKGLKGGEVCIVETPER